MRYQFDCIVRSKNMKKWFAEYDGQEAVVIEKLTRYGGAYQVCFEDGKKLCLHKTEFHIVSGTLPMWNPPNIHIGRSHPMARIALAVRSGRAFRGRVA